MAAPSTKPGRGRDRRASPSPHSTTISASSSRTWTAHGSEEIASLYGSYPLIRSYNNNLHVLVDFDERWFHDAIGATSSPVDREDSVLTVGVSGDHHDTFGGGGWDTYYLFAGTFGDLDIETPAARALDEQTARTEGVYAKLSFSASRLQHIIGPLSLYGAIRGQVASKNLDISEQMELGGANGVRAYPEGEAYGDEGYMATLEARLLLPKWPEQLPGRVQLFTFVDNGYVTVESDPFAAGHNDLTRTGVGVGVSLVRSQQLLACHRYLRPPGWRCEGDLLSRYLRPFLGPDREIFLMAASADRYRAASPSYTRRRRVTTSACDPPSSVGLAPGRLTRMTRP